MRVDIAQIRTYSSISWVGLVELWVSSEFISRRFAHLQEIALA